MPAISTIAVTMRRPSAMRACCTMMSMLAAICSRTTGSGRSSSAISVTASSRARASRGVLACSVVNEPSWPVFMAVSMSKASAPRHSPTTMRSGRMRKALRTRSRMSTRPRPSALAGRASSATRCAWSSRSSAASSIVTMRSPSGIALDRMFSKVVLPEPVPPETSRFLRACTHCRRNRAMGSLSEPAASKSAMPGAAVETCVWSGSRRGWQWARSPH